MENTAISLFAFVPWIVFAPVVGLLINIFLPYILQLINKLFGSKLALGEKTIGAIAVLASATAFGVALLQLYALSLYPDGGQAPLATWIHIGKLAIDWTFRIDTLSVTMMLVVSGVADDPR